MSLFASSPHIVVDALLWVCQAIGAARARDAIPDMADPYKTGSSVVFKGPGIGFCKIPSPRRKKADTVRKLPPLPMSPVAAARPFSNITPLSDIVVSRCVPQPFLGLLYPRRSMSSSLHVSAALPSTLFRSCLSPVQLYFLLYCTASRLGSRAVTCVWALNACPDSPESARRGKAGRWIPRAEGPMKMPVTAMRELEAEQAARAARAATMAFTLSDGAEADAAQLAEWAAQSEASGGGDDWFHDGASWFQTQGWVYDYDANAWLPSAGADPVVALGGMSSVPSLETSIPSGVALPGSGEDTYAGASQMSSTMMMPGSLLDGSASTVGASPGMRSRPHSASSQLVPRSGTGTGSHGGAGSGESARDTSGGMHMSLTTTSTLRPTGDKVLDSYLSLNAGFPLDGDLEERPDFHRHGFPDYT